MRPLAPCWSLPLLFAALGIMTLHPVARAESGSPAELAPGQVSERQAVRSTRQARVRMWRDLARTQAAELDSLGALAAASPLAAGRWQREIEAAKHRHARQEIELQRDLAVREGNMTLARRLDTRLARLAAANGGAR